MNRHAQVISINEFVYHRKLQSYVKDYPLHHAARSGDLYGLKQLIALKKYDIDALDYDGNTPLIHAAKKGKTEIVMHLLALGCNVEVMNKHGDDALISAAINNHASIVKQVLDNGVNLDKLYRGKKTILHVMTEVADHPTFDQIIRKMAFYDHIDEDGNTALLSACLSGHGKQVVELLFYGADPNFQNRIDDVTPLIAAVENGHFNIAKYLLESGAKWDIENAFKENAFYIACTLNDVKMAKLITKYGGRLDA